MAAEAKRLNHSGVAPTTGLASSITASASSGTLNSGTGYPTANFVIKIDGGTAAEEKILCDSRSGTTVTFNASGRGYDGTTATSHSQGTTNVEHCFTAVEADDANRHIYTTTDDDHTQYARTDGTRAFTGGITVSSGGAAVTGNSTVTGNLTVTGSLSAGSGAGITSFTRIYCNTSTISVASLADGQVTGNVQDFTGDSNSPTFASNSLTAVVTGKYLVACYIGTQITGGATAELVVQLKKNGAVVREWGISPYSTGAFTAMGGGTDIISLAANDVLTYYLQNNSTNTADISGGDATQTYLSAVLL